MSESKNHTDLLQMSNPQLLALDEEVLCPRLVQSALSGRNETEILRICVFLSEHPSVEVRGAVVSYIGHLARLHGRLDLKIAGQALGRVSLDPRLQGRVGDA